MPDRKQGVNLPAVVVVEGGAKAIKFYKKLLLTRIKWGQTLRQQMTGQETKEGLCILIWEGIVKEHSFSKWSVVDIKSE